MDNEDKREKTKSVTIENINDPENQTHEDFDQTLYLNVPATVGLLGSFGTSDPLQSSAADPSGPSAQLTIPIEKDDVLPEKESLFRSLTKMHGWKSFLFLGFLIPLLILSPAAILIGLDQNNIPNLSSRNVEELVTITALTVRFSIWGGIVFFAFVFMWFFISLLPGLITRIFILFRGLCPINIRNNLHYIPTLQLHATYLITGILSVVAFRTIFSQTDLIPWWNTFAQILESIRIFSAVFFMQRFFIYKLANNLHDYKGRIKASNHSFYLIEKIRKAAKWERKKKKMATDEKSIASSITPTTLGNLQLNPFKEVEDEGDVDKNVKHDLADVSSNAYATQVAKKLFEKLSSDQITVQLADIKKCLPLGTKAKEVFELFETEEGNPITRKQMIFVIKSFMVTKLDIFKEKRNLEKSIQDLSIALGNLNKIVTILSILLSILLILAFNGINFDSLLPLTSIILALSFIFGGTAQKLFECIVFLFVVHPFDTGDRIFFEESHYLVEEMHLLTTVLTLDGVKIYYPNSVLAQKPILNARRSSAMTAYIKFKVDIRTPSEKIEKLKQQMIDYIKSKPSYYLPKISITLSDFGETNMTTFRISCPHKTNWQDNGLRWEVQCDFSMTLMKYLDELDIVFVLPEQRLILEDKNGMNIQKVH